MITLWRWLRRLARWGAATLVVLLALAAAGVHLPVIPVAGFLGTATLPVYGSWEVLMAGALAALWLWRWHARGSRGALVLSVLAAVSALGLGWGIAQLVRTMQAQHIAIALGRSLMLGRDAVPAMRVETVPYGEAAHRLSLLVYRPKTEAAKALPILVYIHGGGWIGAEPAQRASDMRWFAAQGMLVISLDYTLSTKDQHWWNRTETEIGCGLAWMTGHAARYGGDPGRIVLFGDSAGGNLAINAAYRAAARRLASSCGGVPPRARAVIATYPVVDPASFYRNRDLLLGGVARMMAGRYTGGTPEGVPARYAAVASAGAIDRAAPPTLLLVPEADHLVPAGPSFAFAQRARAAGIDVRLIRVPNADHGFEGGPAGSIGNQILHEASLSFLQDTAVLRR